MEVVVICLPYHVPKRHVPVSNASLYNGTNGPPLHAYFQLILKPELHGHVDTFSSLISRVLCQSFYLIQTDADM